MTENATPPPVPVSDSLVYDLLDILEETDISTEDKTDLLMNLIPYLVERDHKILMHGIETGRASA